MYAAWMFSYATSGSTTNHFWRNSVLWWRGWTKCTYTVLYCTAFFLLSTKFSHKKCIFIVTARQKKQDKPTWIYCQHKCVWSPPPTQKVCGKLVLGWEWRDISGDLRWSHQSCVGAVLSSITHNKNTYTIHFIRQSARTGFRLNILNWSGIKDSKAVMKNTDDSSARRRN